MSSVYLLLKTGANNKIKTFTAHCQNFKRPCFISRSWILCNTSISLHIFIPRLFRLQYMFQVMYRFFISIRRPLHDTILILLHFYLFVREVRRFHRDTLQNWAFKSGAFLCVLPLSFIRENTNFPLNIKMLK